MIKIDGKNKDIYKQALIFLKHCKILSIDTETTGIDPHLDKILIISMGNANQQFVFDVARLEPEHINDIRQLLENPDTLKLLQNAKFDYKMLKQVLNITLNNVYDTMLVEQVLTRGRKAATSGLADIIERHLGIVISKDVRETFAETFYGDELTEEQCIYAAKDVEHLEAVRIAQLRLVERDNLERVVELENKAVLPTGDIELNGIYIDRAKWIGLAEHAYEERELAANELDKFFIPIVDKDLLGHANINYNSPQQLSSALSKITKTKINSTKEEHLKSIDHPAIKCLLAYREKQKQYSTYGSSFLNYVHSITNRIHPDFLQVMGTDSGRYSCKDPNLQNLPARADYREPFCAQYSHTRIVGADYSGMELRILAELSMDPAFLEIFDKGLDAHATVGSMLYDKPIRAPQTLGPDDPGENWDLRRPAKSLNFGIPYGMGPKRFAAAAGIDYALAKKLIAKYWERFPRVKTFFDERVRYAIEHKCAISPLDGRLRWLTDMDLDDIKSRVHAENIAKNFPLQGGNASILKLALIKIREAIVDKDISIINTIHDEILLEAHIDCAEEAKQILQTCMIDAAKHYMRRVPVIAEAYISNHWQK